MKDGETYWVDGYYSTECTHDGNFNRWLLFMMLPIVDFFIYFSLLSDSDNKVTWILDRIALTLVGAILLRTVVVWILSFLDYFFEGILPI